MAADPACRPLAFSIVLTDREPETGYNFQYSEAKPQSLNKKILATQNLRRSALHILREEGVNKILKTCQLLDGKIGLNTSIIATKRRRRNLTSQYSD